jgi:hypothetical protein
VHIETGNPRDGCREPQTFRDLGQQPPVIDQDDLLGRRLGDVQGTPKDNSTTTAGSRRAGTWAGRRDRPSLPEMSPPEPVTEKR